MKRTILIPLFLLWLFPFRGYGLTTPDSLSIVPAPVMMKGLKGTFRIDAGTRLEVPESDPEVVRLAQWFISRLEYEGGPSFSLRKTSGGKPEPATIRLRIRPGLSLPPEGYELTVTPSNVLLESSSPAGLFRGMQTLIQLVPPGTSSIPCLKISDHPRFDYRGMHLDVSRHFFPVSFVKKHIDLIAMFRMNTFHWHLTDDNGWRIQIMKYPLLTETGAWRADRDGLPWTERPPQQPGEKATYGGFYTREEIMEVVQYAAERYIRVIPEIEMPAHSAEVLAAYPRFSCKGGTYTVPTGSYWPNADILCAGNDSVFTFVQDVLAEVATLFPGEYIHIGGDEADRTNWKSCPKCLARMEREGLRDDKELQSWFIRRVQKFVAGTGKKMIGWDEILDGGLAPEATVMSWRGVEGAIEAARMGHDAIMTPVSHCYFDYYQADPASEPPAIGGFTTLKKVYSYEPIPEELTRSEAVHILGAQGNLWTEYISTPSHAEYMALPRMIALAEVTWSPKEKRNWTGFRSRLHGQLKRLDRLGFNYSQGSFRVRVSTGYDQQENVLKVTLSSEQPHIPIRYTTNGNEVDSLSTAYTGPFPMKSNGYIRAGLFPGNRLREKPTEMPVIVHLATGKPIRYVTRYSNRYPADGDHSLTDGLRGSTDHRDGQWLGFNGTDAECIIDLGREMPVRSVQCNFLQNQRSWILLPSFVEYSLSSDGKKYHSFNEVLHKISPKEEQALIQPFNFRFMEGTTARFIRVKAKNAGPLPAWHAGAGQPAWLFTDEIVVY